MSLSELFHEHTRALTFSIAKSHFCIDVTRILSFSDEYQNIQLVNNPDMPGFVGHLEYRDSLINVYDSASILNRERDFSARDQLKDEIEQYKNTLTTWLTELETALTAGAAFTPNPLMHNLYAHLGAENESSVTEHEDLTNLINSLDDAYSSLVQSGQALVQLCLNGEQPRAIRLLGFEKATTVKKILRILDVIAENLTQTVQPVVLHLTKDGKQPWYSIVLDEVEDIIDYDPKDLEQQDISAITHEPIDGYLRHSSGKHFIMLSVEKIHDLIINMSIKAGQPPSAEGTLLDSSTESLMAVCHDEPQKNIGSTTCVS